MFNNKRYLTRGVNADIPEEFQILMWHSIDTMDGEKDYLQVFNLEPSSQKGIPVQKITHTQEIPPYKKVFYIPYDNPIKEKIFIIDDQTHSTMLLASEY